MFNLSFRVFGTSIKITIWFWVFSALFGYMMGVHREGWQIFLVWILCNLIAWIVKEVGHVIAGRFFGIPGGIVLGGMGGSAVGDYAQAPRWQQIIIYAAGPITALAFYSLIFFGAHKITTNLANFGRFELIAFWGMTYLAFLTLFWNLLNLLPILPMDGGKILQAAIGYVVGRRDFLVAAIVSFLLAASVAGYSIYRIYHPEVPFVDRIMRPLYPTELRNGNFARVDADSTFMAFIFGFYAITNLIGIFKKPKPPEESRRVW
jgi:stage IV sporulation protein FB